MKVVTIRDPESFSEAAKDSWWDEAMNEEMQALSKNEAWDHIPSSLHQKAIGWSRLIYKLKHNADDTVNRYKAQLVAKGYAQTHGIDYKETFAPVAKMMTIRTIVVLARVKGWHVHQMGVNNVFFKVN